MPETLVLTDEVADAVGTGRPVVALESTILAHGLPRGENRVAADRIEDAVRAGGAVPATVAVLDGTVRIGLGPAELDRLCDRDGIAKLSVRDLGAALALGVDGATTVASTSALAHRAGIAVFATGGLGGVHREAGDTFDVSADLRVLGRTPIVVVCAGVKSILDVGGTLEYLETLSVPVLGYRTDRFPGFYLSDSGFGVPWRIDDAAQAAAIQVRRRQLGLDDAAVVVANPLPPDRQLDPGLHDRTLEQGLAMLAAESVTGKDVTPRLLEFFHQATGGASLRVNLDLVLSNAALAAAIAVALAQADPAR
ncbi:pseudouridine-5'-phosphate glycosidase [Nakamurella sp.]|uniref:pseudouridine-5'-phosphate glycosidase n=1 Tax=Nakamurella sp. TaxID=1869182 RepID=UPI003B3A3B8B